MKQIWYEVVGALTCKAWWDEWTGTLRIEMHANGGAVTVTFGTHERREDAIREVIAQIDAAQRMEAK